MKVIFDCTVLANWTGHHTGIQRVVSEIGKELQRCLPGTCLGYFSADNGCLNYSLEEQTTLGTQLLNEGDIVITAGHNWDYPSHHERLIALQDQGIRLGTLFYDTIPVLLPFTYGPGFAAIFENWLKESLEASEIGFSISENTKSDLGHFAGATGVRCPEIYIVRLGDDVPTSNASPSAAILEKTASPFILSVGTIEYRKNHILLLNAYRYMIERMEFLPPKLYLVGKKGWMDHDIEYQIANDHRLIERVEILQGISDADLRHLYQQAMFTVYPSFYEGWGLPVAESMCFGKPCIASRSSSMIEIAPGLVRHADPYLLQEWVEQIRVLSEDPALLSEEAEHIKVSYHRHSWAETANQMKAALLQHYPQLKTTSA